MITKNSVHRAELSDVPIGLKQCPFCGEDTDLELWTTHGYVYNVRCGHCSAEVTGEKGKGTYGTKLNQVSAAVNAVHAWNKRA